MGGDGVICAKKKYLTCFIRFSHGIQGVYSDGKNNHAFFWDSVLQKYMANGFGANNKQNIT